MNDALLLRFKTDSTIVSKGFSASYIAVESMVPSSEYSSQIDEDDIDLTFHKAKLNKKKKSSTNKAIGSGGRGNEDDEDDDDDDDDDDEGMLAAKSPW